MAVDFCILGAAGEQSLKNANVYEKLNALEHRAGDLQSSFACNTARETRHYGKIATTWAAHYRWCLRATQHKAMCFLIMWWILQWKAECFVLASADCSFFFFFFFFSCQKCELLSSPDIRGCGKILKETNRVKWGLCLYLWLLNVCVCVWTVCGYRCLWETKKFLSPFNLNSVSTLSLESFVSSFIIALGITFLTLQSW